METVNRKITLRVYASKKQTGHLWKRNARRFCGDKTIGIDWGTGKFLTIDDSFGDIEETANPRLMKQYETKLKKSQQLLSSKKKGSKNRLKSK